MAKMDRLLLLKIYKRLKKHHGHLNWWPGDTRFEIMVGAILTQNTSWRNVEKALDNLKKAKCLNASAIHSMPARKLAGLIRPAGYYNVKARRLKNFVRYFFTRYRGSAAVMKRENGEKLRSELLAVNGVGRETADSILLYALDKPFFVVDAYTKRVLTRHRMVHESSDYETMRRLFENNLPKRVDLYNDFHAQIVKIGNNFCRKSSPLCDACPLSPLLPIKI